MSKGIEAFKRIGNAIDHADDIALSYLKEGDFDIVDKELKALEVIKECCEFDFIKKEENDKPIRYEIHIRRKGGDNIFFPCLAIYPKNREDFDLLKEVLL